MSTRIEQINTHITKKQMAEFYCQRKKFTNEQGEVQKKPCGSDEIQRHQYEIMLILIYIQLDTKITIDTYISVFIHWLVYVHTFYERASQQ